jgi:hypothetical protein
VNVSITRGMWLAVAGAAAAVAALVAIALVAGSPAQAHTRGHTHAVPVTKAELAFRNDMRKLWEDHIVWTRMAIVSLTSDAADTDASVGRLLQNQADIGAAIKPFYGEAAGDELTRLLREHITVAADLVIAAKTGDDSGFAAAQAAWQANADEIAEFLNGANPRQWPLAEMKAMMREHLELTTQEAIARLQGDWAADVAAYDEIHVHALHMADMLSVGIVKQFPGSFR